MTAAEWRVGIISFFPRERMQRSDLGSGCHASTSTSQNWILCTGGLKTRLDWPTLSAEPLLCRKADQVFTTVASKALSSGVRLPLSSRVSDCLATPLALANSWKSKGAARRIVKDKGTGLIKPVDTHRKRTDQCKELERL
jgi:hypothetical protein